MLCPSQFVVRTWRVKVPCQKIVVFVNCALVRLELLLPPDGRLKPCLFHNASYTFVVDCNAVCPVEPYGHSLISICAMVYALSLSYRFYQRAGRPRQEDDIQPVSRYSRHHRFKTDVSDMPYDAVTSAMALPSRTWACTASSFSSWL